MTRSRALPVFVLLLAGSLACGPPSSGVMSSDGLVFVRRVGKDTDLFRARIFDGSVRALWTTPGRSERWPYWSDNAGKLIFEASPYEGAPRPESAAHDDPDHRLLLFDPSSGTESLLSQAPALLEHWANWSPSGDRVLFAFSSHLGVSPSAGLAMAQTLSGERRVAVSSTPDGRLFRARFSPDEKHFVAQRFNNRRGTSKLWIFPEEGEPRALTQGKTGVDSKPRFTRDSSFVVFTRRHAVRQDGDICIIATAGGPPRIIVSVDGADDHAADPSPTRDEIAFASNRSGNYEIWLADLDGGEARNITNTPDIDEGAVHFSPDGERLVVSRTAVGVDPTLPPVKRPAPQLAVLDRDGKMLFETEGFSPDWMPPWR